VAASGGQRRPPPAAARPASGANSTGVKLPRHRHNSIRRRCAIFRPLPLVLTLAQPAGLPAAQPRREYRRLRRRRHHLTTFNNAPKAPKEKFGVWVYWLPSRGRRLRLRRLRRRFRCLRRLRRRSLPRGTAGRRLWRQPGLAGHLKLCRQASQHQPAVNCVVAVPHLPPKARARTRHDAYTACRRRAHCAASSSYAIARRRCAFGFFLGAESAARARAAARGVPRWACVPLPRARVGARCGGPANEQM
jgi:hypothetical protein